jgi:hypothetical protein
MSIKKTKLHKAIVKGTTKAAQESDPQIYIPTEKCLTNSFYLCLLRREEFLFSLSELPSPSHDRSSRAKYHSCFLLGFAAFETTLRYVYLWCAHDLHSKKKLTDSQINDLLEDKGISLKDRIKKLQRVIKKHIQTQADSQPEKVPKGISNIRSELLSEEEFKDLDELIYARNLLVHKNYIVDLKRMERHLLILLGAGDHSERLNKLYIELFENINLYLSLSSKKYYEKDRDGREISLDFKDLLGNTLNTNLL